MGHFVAADDRAAGGWFFRDELRTTTANIVDQPPLLHPSPTGGNRTHAKAWATVKKG